jgi:hypothetical protein
MNMASKRSKGFRIMLSGTVLLALLVIFVFLTSNSAMAVNAVVYPAG